MSDHAVQPAEAEPIDMVLFCPQCGRQHIDAPEAGVTFMQDASGRQSDATTNVGAWDNPPHRSHLCHGCGHVWRPADVPTNGVAAVKTTGKADSPIAQPARASGDATAMEDDVTAARAILGRLCDNGLVRMSIPVRPDDEDMVLSRVIERAASNSLAQPCAAPAAAPIASPSAYVNGAGIIAADGPGVVVRKLDAAFRKATKAGQVAQAEAAPDWRELAARVMDALAEEQERINAECPEHAKCYPSWAHHARRCRWHAEMFRSGKPVGGGAGAPAVLAALAAAPKRDALDEAERADFDRLRALVNTPTLHSFRDGVVLEAVHQRERWGSDHDAGKTPADWFWLVGHLAGKALHAQASGNTEKALHHTISTAAALANWHAAIAGDHTAMRPGINPASHSCRSSQEGACIHGKGFQCVTCWPHPAAPSDAAASAKKDGRPTHG